MNESAQGLAEAAAAFGLSLSVSQLDKFETYRALIEQWNRRFNLVGPSALANMWSRHFLDALTVVSALPQGASEDLHVLDVGSGAGLPGIALRIALPHWTMSLLEVTTKKVRFLELAIRVLDLEHTAVLHGRAEEIAHDWDYREKFDLCVARAVSSTAALVEVTLPFVAPGGSAIYYKSAIALSGELNAAEDARHLLGGGAPAITTIGRSHDDLRCLVRYDKISRTPAEYPRAAGMPEMRPISAADHATAKAAKRSPGPA
jgi:16S rRNA (guanine527-N7)-methyltransferase